MNKNLDIFDDEELLKKNSPLLHSIPKENPFSVPDGYFDSLPSEIIEKCRKEVQPKKWGEGFLTTLLMYKWRLLTVTGCAAIICFFTIRLNNNSASYEAIAKTIPDSLIVEHLSNNIVYVSESSLEDMQEPESTSVAAKNVSDSANNDQEIIAYLMDNDVNVSDIVNE